MRQMIIRSETPEDTRIVEEITRKAFWNLYVPGCAEHYLVHVMRSHPDFIPQLDLVAELDKQVIGSIQYTKAWLTDSSGLEKEIATFGPVSILPGYQRKGYGKALIEASLERAVSLGYEAVVIFGNPGNYVSRGFQSCKKYHVCTQEGIYPSAMLVKELKPGVLAGRRWVYRGSEAYEIAPEKAQEFDEGFEPLEKRYRPSQEEFYIHSHSILR